MIQEHPTTVPELTKRHGTALRLMPAGTKRYNRRMRQLCVQRMPGPDLTRILNQELGLNWTLQAHFQRAKNLGLSWIPAERTGRRLTPAEHLPEDQRTACHEDPAWEARNGWSDRVVCRKCFIIFRDGGMHGKRGHLSKIEGITSSEGKTIAHNYNLLHPGAPIFTSQRIASQEDRDVHEVMAKFADQYVTPAVRAAAVADPEYEAHNDITEYVICRVARCGFKATSGLTKHLRNVHEIEDVKTYRRTHGWPEIYSRRLLMKMRTEVSQRMANLKAQAKAAQQGQQQPKKKRQTADTGFRITLVAYLYTVAPDRAPDYKMARQLFPKQNVMRIAYDNTVKFVKRHREAIEREKQRLSTLSATERESEAKNARLHLAR